MNNVLKTVFVISLLVGCSSTTQNPKNPENDSSCYSACMKMEKLGCAEGKSLEDGTSCTKFCIDTVESGHALNTGCIISDVVRNCSDIKICFGE